MGERYQHILEIRQQTEEEGWLSSSLCEGMWRGAHLRGDSALHVLYTTAAGTRQESGGKFYRVQF